MTTNLAAHRPLAGPASAPPPAAPEPAPRPGRIPAAVRAAAAVRPARPALRALRGDARIEIAYGELIARVERAAERLTAIGIEPGDRVALFSENRPEWLIAYLGILEARASAVPIDRQLKDRDVRSILETAEARALIASPGALEVLSPETRGDLRQRGVPALDVAPGLPLHPGAAEACGAPPPRPPGTPDDRDPAVASIIFTSGTTGRPKGVVLTHENLLASVWAGLGLVPFDENDEILSILPLHHVFEFMIEMGALVSSATITYVEAIRGDVLVQAMRETGTTIFAAVPRLLDLFRAGIDRKVAARGRAARASFAVLQAISRAARAVGIDLRRRLFRRVHEQFGGRIRLVLSGAAPLPLEVWRDLEGLGFPIAEGYGLTETSPLVSAHAVADYRFGTVGRPVAGVEVRIFHPDSQGEGEIVVRGPNVMRGYFRDAEATRAAIRDGWFHTGDLGRLDRDGYLRITGRVKELIVTAAGKKVAPPDVEARYGAIEGVKELAVFGARAGSLGEEVHAALVLEEGAFPPGTPEEDIRRALAARLETRARTAGLASYMRIQRFHIVPELPKTTTLKVKRHELRALAAAPATAPAGAPAPAASEPDAPAVAGVLEVLRAVAKERAAGASLASTLQFDIGLDSLERMEVLASLEARSGARFPEDLAPRLHTVRDLVEAVERHRGAGEGGASDRPAAPPEGAAAPAPPVPAPRGPAACLGLGALRLAARALYGLRGRGLENVPAGPAIFCPNHESHLDIFFVASLLPPAARRALVCFAKREHFDAAATRAFASFARAIPIDRDGDVRPALRAAAYALHAGRPLLIHPEGTRTKTGALGAFRAGAARLALETGVPLVPVKIAGAFAIYPESRRLPRLFDWRRGRRLSLSVSFGEPLAPRAGESAEALTERLRAAVQGP